MRTDSFYITKTSKQCNCCLVNFGNSQYKLFQNSVTCYMWVGVRKAEAQLTRTYFEIKYAPFQIKGYDPFRLTAVSKSLASKLCAFILKTCVAFHASQRLFFVPSTKEQRAQYKTNNIFVSEELLETTWLIGASNGLWNVNCSSSGYHSRLYLHNKQTFILFLPPCILCN